MNNYGCNDNIKKNTTINVRISNDVAKQYYQISYFARRERE